MHYNNYLPAILAKFSALKLNTRSINNSMKLKQAVLQHKIVDAAIYTCHIYPVDMNKGKTNGGKGLNVII